MKRKNKLCCFYNKEYFIQYFIVFSKTHQTLQKSNNLAWSMNKKRIWLLEIIKTNFGDFKNTMIRAGLKKYTQNVF